MQFLPSAAICADGYFRRSLRPAVCPLVCSSVCPSVRPERRYRSNSLRISVISLTFGEMVHSNMKQIAIQNDHGRLFLHVPWKFSKIGLVQEDEIEEITLRPEILWHDAVYHEAVWNGHTQLMFAFSDLGRPRVLSFSERLVQVLTIRFIDGY